MNITTRNTALTLFVALTAAALVSSVAVAVPPKKALLVTPGEPHPGMYLPKFGFSSFNINGFGERVTFVKWNGRAANLGLEPGDVILSLNGYSLNYHGSWNDALTQAMYEGGYVQLKIRDVRTGSVVYRETYVGGGYGPVTPKYQVNYGYGPNTPHVIHHHNGPYGKGGNTVKQIVKLIDELND